MVYTKVIVFVAIGAALSTVAAAPVVHVGENGSSLLNQDVCTSPDCAATAAQIVKDMNANADPCEDFSEFSCGGFYQNTVLSETIPSTEHLSDLVPKNLAIVRELADPSFGKAPQAAPGDTAGQSNLKKLHDMYASCMDVTTIQRVGRQPLVNQLQTVLSLLPESATVDKTGLSKVMAGLTKLQILPFYTIIPGPNVYDPNLNILTGVLGGLSLPATAYNQSLPDLADLESKIALQFQTFLAAEDVYAHRTTPITVADVDQEWLDAAKDVVAFETLLADATIKNPGQSKGPKGFVYNPHSFGELSAMTPSIDWSTLLSELIPAEVEYTRPINLQASAFLPALETVLQSTTTKTLRNYFAWRIIDSQSKILETPYNLASETTERWKTCSQNVAAQLPDITGHYFVERVLPESSQTVFRSMIKNVISAY
ncbi:Endothelin-converting enzyme 2, partial [Linnemannia gamsii]